MPIFRRSKSSAEKPPRDGPEQWAAKARAVDEEVRRQREVNMEAERIERDKAQLRRASEVVGEVAVSSAGDAEPSLPGAAAKAVETVEQPETREDFFPIEVLNQEYLRHFAERRGYLAGKFIRVGNLIFLSNSVAVEHNDMLEFARKALEGRELEDTDEELLNPEVSGLVDAGKYNVIFWKAAPSSDGTEGRFGVYGYSAHFGLASEEGRSRTVEIAGEVLGEHIRASEGES